MLQKLRDRTKEVRVHSGGDLDLTVYFSGGVEAQVPPTALFIEYPLKGISFKDVATLWNLVCQQDGWKPHSASQSLLNQK